MTVEIPLDLLDELPKRGYGMGAMRLRAVALWIHTALGLSGSHHRLACQEHRDWIHVTVPGLTLSAALRFLVKAGVLESVERDARGGICGLFRVLVSQSWLENEGKRAV